MARQVESQTKLSGPTASFGQSFLQQGARDIDDQADTFGCRDEDGRRHRAKAWAVPAGQRLETQRRHRLRVEDRLENERQFIVEHGHLQSLFDNMVVANLRFVFRAEQHGFTAQNTLGEVERIVGAFEQEVRRRRIVGIDGQAHRTADMRLSCADIVRQAELVANTAAQALQPVFRYISRNQQGEFIAAQSRQGQALPLGVAALCGLDIAQALADFAQQAVAGRMAIGVVDRLEAVEVDNTDGEARAGLFGLFVELGQGRKERAAVGQARQAVEIGDLEIFI